MDSALRVAMKSKGNTHSVHRITVEKHRRAIREVMFISGELRFNYGKNVEGRDSILIKFHVITECMQSCFMDRTIDAIRSGLNGDFVT